MTIEISRLSTRLALLDFQIRGHTRMILDEHLWGSNVAVAERARNAALLERQQLVLQIAALKELSAIPRGRMHS